MPTSPNRTITRRTFIQHTATAGVVLPLGMPPLVRAASPNGKLNVAGVGTGRRGWAALNLVVPGQNVVAICDVDQGPANLGQAAEKWPNARRYTDWRRMLDRPKDIDAITVGIPDHNHAVVTLAALSLGLHVYCEKPLTHDVEEARLVAEAARSTGLVTQMGNQGHASVGYRTVVELIRDGVVGKAKEVHCWAAPPSWPIMSRRPLVTHTPPASLDWDLWLGAAPHRPYVDNSYHPWAWRGWIDFGTGQQGDFGCHIIDPPYWALELTAPTAVRVQTPPPLKETYAAWRKTFYRFPGTKWTADNTINLTWYDGGLKPTHRQVDLPDDVELPRAGHIIVGTEGVMLTQHSARLPKLYPTEKFRDFEYPQLEEIDHGQQFTQACLGNGQTASHFDYAGPLTETVMLGNVGYRFPNQTLRWDAPNLRITNLEAANRYLRRQYRRGWDPAKLG
ncbi:MAG: Gfo/Idh/MocA family protein [Planctomycetota bacterium]|jgi:predicted dehydrogenase